MESTLFAQETDPNPRKKNKRFEFTGMAVAPDGSLYLVTPNSDLNTSVIKRIIYSDRPVEQLPPVGKDVPIVTIASHSDGDKFSYNERVNFSGSAKDIDGNDIEPENLKWRANIIHFNHRHTFADSTGPNGSFLVRSHDDAGYMELCLTAKDNQARVGQSCVDLLPNRTSLILQSEPSGIPLTYINGGTVTTKPSPFTSNVVTNVQRQIIAEEIVSVNGKSYKFVGWEHEGVTDNRANFRFDTKASPMIYKAVYMIE